ncbi:hypothetical protein EVAR_49018_1 [Eumeta japonica]|uniref:Uncharacterized protein n=1 Tax=Eumeta variegata TaxID=151549 RepID=A0A4C1XP07_EUMVA|nr:hypothetical protein EVAR_49018_1 [Eumeta japonica]
MWIYRSFRAVYKYFSLMTAISRVPPLFCPLPSRRAGAIRGGPRKGSIDIEFGAAGAERAPLFFASGRNESRIVICSESREDTPDKQIDRRIESLFKAHAETWNPFSFAHLICEFRARCERAKSAPAVKDGGSVVKRRRSSGTCAAPRPS